MFIVSQSQNERVTVHDCNIYIDNTLHITLSNTTPILGDLQLICTGPWDKASIIRGEHTYSLKVFELEQHSINGYYQLVAKDLQPG